MLIYWTVVHETLDLHTLVESEFSEAPIFSQIKNAPTPHSSYNKHIEPLLALLLISVNTQREWKTQVHSMPAKYIIQMFHILLQIFFIMNAW